MEIIWKLIGLLPIPILLWSAWVMVSRTRHQLLLTASGLVWPVVVGLATVAVYVLLLGESLGSAQVWLPLGGAAVAGGIWSRTATLGRFGERVTCRRSSWTLLIWGLSFVPVQLLAVLESDLFATLGVGLLLAASGLALGEHIGLFIRRQQLLKTPRAEALA